MDKKEKCNNCQRRRLLVATAAVGGLGLIGATIPFLASLGPTEPQKILSGPIDVTVDDLRPGEIKTVSWREKPILLFRRTAAMMENLKGHSDRLAHPEVHEENIPAYCRNLYRAREEQPALLVMIGLCTHLGCIPVPKFQAGETSGLGADWPGGFLCPCHGASFDLAGRVFKDTPAPTNLAIPPYHYVSGTQLRIGEDETRHG